MSEKIRNRRTVIAAGVLSLALVAPATNVPVIQDLALPVAYAATDASIFGERYKTDNFWDKNEAKIIGLTLDAGDKVEPTTSTIFNWNVRNDNGELVLIRPKSNTAYKKGDVDIPVKVTPAGGASFNTTLKVTVIDEADTTWVKDLPDFKTRQSVDFSNGLIQDIPGLTVPDDATVEKDGIAHLGWKVVNNNGVLRVEAPATFSGSVPENKDINIKITKNGHTEPVTLLLKATPPEKSAAGGTAGTVGGALLPILGGIIGLIPGAGPLGNALGSLGNLIGGLGGGNNGGTGGNNGGTGGTGGNTGGRGGIFDGMFRDAVKIEVKDNGSHNASNNTGIAPSAVAPSAVVVTDNASNNGSNNTGVAPSAVNVSDNGSNNTGVAPSAVNVSDNGSNNTGVAPSAVNVSDNGSNNTGIAPSAVAPGAVNVSDIASNNTGVAPSAVNVSDNGSNNTGIAPTAVAPGAVNVSDIASNNTGLAPNAVNVLPEGLGGSSGKKDSGTAGGAGAAATNSKLNDPKCIASLVGVGVPLAILIPVLAFNVLRVPGAEGFQDMLKAAASTLPGLNVSPEQLGAGIGAFAGAFAVLGMIGAITQCVPDKADAQPNPSPTTGEPAPSAPVQPSAPASEPSQPTTTTP
ncbi:hypothetical protein [Corynebacterium aquatimens]|uniref:hypothetical protein n=1 Tax=Corynebacterium aquatimens TaxID=1190508 RepID=UPI00361E6DB7